MTALPAHERRAVLAAVRTLLLAIVIVRTRGLGAALSAVRRARRRPTPDLIGPCRLGTLTLATADHLPLAISCLERSVAVAWILARHGHTCALVVESQTLPQFAARTFTAHAWVDTAEGTVGRGAHDPTPEITRWTLP